MDTPDRRCFSRASVERACKVFHRASRRYLAGRTCDLSSGGALIRLENVRPLAPGDEIDLVVAWGTAGVVRQASLIPARVARVATAFGQHQAVGVRYDLPQHMAAVA